MAKCIGIGIIQLLLILPLTLVQYFSWLTAVSTLLLSHESKFCLLSTLTIVEFKAACSLLGVLWGSFVTSHKSWFHTLWEILADQTTLGRFITALWLSSVLSQGPTMFSYPFPDWFWQFPYLWVADDMVQYKGLQSSLEVFNQLCLLRLPLSNIILSSHQNSFRIESMQG